MAGYHVIGGELKSIPASVTNDDMILGREKRRGNHHQYYYVVLFLLPSIVAYILINKNTYHNKMIKIT